MIVSLLWICLSIQTAAGQETFFQFDDLDVEELSGESMTGSDQIIYISDRWKFMSGDNTEWANPDFDDSDWSVISTNLTVADLSFVDWEGIGWFRKKLRVSGELAGKPLALVIDRHLGASEIYLNGEKVYELGRFSTNPDRVEPYSGNELPVIVFPDTTVQSLAVRFINPNNVESTRIFGNNGFRFLLADWKTHQDQVLSYISNWTGISMFYAGVLLTFAVIHLLLFIFYPREKRNLYFSLFAGGLLLITYFLYRLELASFTIATISFLRFALFFEIIVLAFAVRLMYSINEKQKSVYANLVLIAGLLAASFVYFYPADLVWIRELIILIFVAELLRTLYLMYRSRKEGAWIIGAGMLFFVLGLITSLLINFQFISGDVRIINMTGSGLLILSMSIFLSRDFAVTRKNLQQKLVEVQELSDRALEQERIGKEREIERRLLEAENRRKTTELEEARALQLSMLPKKMPSVNGYDLAVYMDTATEVGGDYYDYSTEQDGSIVLALGDATGHGLKAGIMVAAAKSYFHTLVHEVDLCTMLKRISSGLRNLNMHLMYMGFILAKCQGNRVQITIAGMPPVLYYSRKSNSVEQIVLKGLPLGGNVNFPYQTKELQLDRGDVLLLMSDGLMELFNQDRDILGMEKIEQVLLNSVDFSSADIIQQVNHLAETWTGGKDPEDDITLMVLKIPEN
ncbi:PP2C family protein-serine/threonine phosphatase [Rhodohalobacter sp.]|uniref:PP2C family protein-serine/threonine phosphatase n=1 Tax=Rhodohalobacter sp. TaxID=1974210 RepID=UPI002ACEEA70|nr:SpoIIE family protein phosphatase [Rhodohalobacter sp.]MDZ7757652.1 SpoIIE family protein phosphatase [Rhodohalobacter sp.]